MAEYKVVEKFVSINGEGTKAGQLAVFIRFQGCNLNCSFCDTKWANQPDAPYTKMTENEILTYIQETGVKNVTLTGGEPLLRPDMHTLLETLQEDASLRVEIETNGSIALSQYRFTEDFPLFTMDYKLPGSGMEAQMRLDNILELKRADTIKFVVGSKDDLVRAEEIIIQNDLTNRCHVYLSPVFDRIHPEDIVKFMIERKMNNVNLQLQMHKFIWNPEKRGV